MNLNTKITYIFLFLVTFSQYSKAQDFMMQGWYWDYPKTANGHNWADTLLSKTTELGDAGFTHIWLPPFSIASFGNGSNGYDPKDLYDLGNTANPTGFGTRTDVDDLIAAFSTVGIDAVADVVYNHRDGGRPELNPSVEGWIENMNCTKVNAGDNPYPSDRFRCYLPLGGSSGNGASTYYFKIKSASGHPNFYGNEYKMYMQTNTVGFQGNPQDTENEGGGGNGGGDCGQGNNTIQLGVDMIATIDNIGSCGGFCGIDEFQLTIGSGDFNAAGDTLWITMNNQNSGYSDHYITGLWDGSADIQSQIAYQTYTDFTNLPSGRGDMDYTFFKPNGNPTQLSGDWDAMLFFYDYDQRYTQKTKDSLNVWTKWLWEEVGIRGLRMDAVKHFNNEYVGDLMDYLHDQNINPGMVVGEFFDTSPNALKNWVDAVESNMDLDTKNAIKVRTFDFALRAELKGACDNFGYDVRNIFNSGIVNGVGANAFNVVTFVNNHDYRDAGQPVQNDPMLAYAYILTDNQIGLPNVFYPDYFGEDNLSNYPANVFLQGQIDSLMKVHQDYIYQSSSVDYLSRFSTPYSSNFISGFDNTTLLYQLSGGVGGEEVIVAINFAGGTDTLKVDHQINMNNLAIGDTLRDVLGRSTFPYALVNGNSEIYIELPPRSYSVWVSSPALGPVPLELLDFSVEAKSDRIALNWSSLNEINFSGYEIQRSTDGIRFENIGWITGKGNGHYAFDDKNPLFNTTLYYRLKLRDMDGKFSYSDVQTAYLKKAVSNLKLFPNPTDLSTTLSFESQVDGRGSLELIDVHGNRIAWETQRLEKGENKVVISTDAFAAGVYFVRLNINEEEVAVLRLLKF